MSFPIHVTEAKFKISAKDLEKAVEKAGYEDFDELESMLAETGWVVTLDAKGNVSDIDYDKPALTGDIHSILPSLAPFIKAGSFIQMAGDGGKIGGWEFNGKRCKCTGFAAEQAGYADYLKELRTGGAAESEEEPDEDDDDEEEEDDDEDEADDDASEPD